MRKLRVTVEGKSYDVTVEVLGPAKSATKAPAVAEKKAAPVAAKATAAKKGDVPSPLSGKVVAVAVEVGAQVAEGDNLVTVEAMKMNTYVTAPTAGKVTRVVVSVGDAVEEGSPVVTIE